MFLRLPHSFLAIVMIGLLFLFSTVAFVAPEQVVDQQLLADLVHQASSK